MKKLELENIINKLNDIKKFSDSLDYNTSSYINKQLVTILSTLHNEYDRMDIDKIEINCPRIKIIKLSDIEYLYDTNNFVDAVNLELKELTVNGYKIIDYDVEYYIANPTSVVPVCCIIKYTS